MLSHEVTGFSAPQGVLGVQRVATWGGVSMLGRLAAVGARGFGEPMAVVGAVAVIEVG
jgi:hypothetical protein